jgi:hypothetical protein
VDNDGTNRTEAQSARERDEMTPFGTSLATLFVGVFSSSMPSISDHIRLHSVASQSGCTF